MLHIWFKCSQIYLNQSAYPTITVSVSGKIECGQLCVNSLKKIYCPSGPTGISSVIWRYSILNGLAPSQSGTDGELQPSHRFLVTDNRQLTDILESLIWINKSISHIYNHSLDFMIFSKGRHVLPVSIPDQIFDHFSVVADLTIPANHTRTVPQTNKYWKLQWLTMQTSRQIVSIPNWLNILQPMQQNWHSNTTVSSVLSLLWLLQFTFV